MKNTNKSIENSGLEQEQSQKSGLSHWTQSVKDPRDPVGRIKLSELMNFDNRCTPKHKIVWEFHLGWAHKDYDWTSLASVRTIRDVLTSRSPSGKALSIRHISAANRDLCAWGYITEIQKGSGRWASRFNINWDLLELAAKGDFPISVTHEGNANLAYPLEDTQSTGKGYANDGLCIPQGVRRPDYLDPAKDGDIGSGNVSPPQAADGLPATAPGCGFEDAWRAYGKLGNKQLARAAWAEFDPDSEQAARIIERAASWAASAKPGQRRMMFQKWLAAEKWDEADHTPAANDNGKTRRLEVDCYFVEDDHMRVVFHGQTGFVRLVGASADAVYDAVQDAGTQVTQQNMTIANRGAFVSPPDADDIFIAPQAQQ